MTAFSNRNIEVALNQALTYFELCVAEPEIKRDLYRFPPSTLEEAVRMAKNYAVAMQLILSQQLSAAFAIEAASDQDALITEMQNQKGKTSGTRTSLKAIAEAPAQAKGDVYKRLEKIEKVM